jgi:hypothetical protein
MVYFGEDGGVLEVLKGGNNDRVKGKILNQDQEGVTWVGSCQSSHRDHEERGGKDGLVRPVGGEDVWFIVEQVISDILGALVDPVLL